MMTKPGITELDRCVDSRYTLVSMAAKRARMIGIERKAAEDEAVDTSGYDPSLDKPVTQAVNEISAGVVGYVRSEAIEKAKEYEEEKFEAIMQLEKGTAESGEEIGEAEQAEEPEQTEAPAQEAAPEAEETGEESELGLLDAALAAARAGASITDDGSGDF